MHNRGKRSQRDVRGGRHLGQRASQLQHSYQNTLRRQHRMDSIQDNVDFDLLEEKSRENQLNRFKVELIFLEVADE